MIFALTILLNFNPKDTVIHLYSRSLFAENKTDTLISNNRKDTTYFHHYPKKNKD